jgi:hypothetical protein
MTVIKFENQLRVATSGFVRDVSAAQWAIGQSISAEINRVALFYTQARQHTRWGYRTLATAAGNDKQGQFARKLADGPSFGDFVGGEEIAQGTRVSLGNLKT